VRTWLQEWADSLNSEGSTDEAILLGAKLGTILAARTDSIAHLTSLRVSWRELVILAPSAFNMSLWTSRSDRLLMIGGIGSAQEGFREPPTHLRRLPCLWSLFKEDGHVSIQWNGRFHCDAVLPRRADADNVLLFSCCVFLRIWKPVNFCRGKGRPWRIVFGMLFAIECQRNMLAQ
jgi:hypothetical protein